MFEGYSQETVDFLWGIRFNNERGWFMEHKQDYQKYLLEPTRALAEQVYEGLQKKLPREPLMMKVSRIYRDARRLHGRGPYKDHLWFAVRTGDENWQGRPTFFFEIAPDYYSYGLGFWCAKSAAMEQFRKTVADDPSALEKIDRSIRRHGHFQLTGEEYVRPKPSPSKVLQPWVQKKHISVHFEEPLDERIFHPELAQEIIDQLSELVPLYRYLARVCAAME